TTDGDFHRQHRRLLQPAFSRRRVDNYAGLIVQYTKETLERWQPGAQIDIAHDLQTLILRITMKMLVDVDVLNESAELGYIIDGLLGSSVGLLEGLLNLQIDLPFMPYGRRMASLRKADAYIYNLIDQRLADQHDVGDILSILLQAMDGHEGTMT